MSSTSQKITRAEAEAIVNKMSYEEVLRMIAILEGVKRREIA